MMSDGPLLSNRTTQQPVDAVPTLQFDPGKLAERIKAMVENSNRLAVPPGQAHWGERVAQSIVERFPTQSIYTCAAGISPSGIVHFGNFRDVVTSLIVARSLQNLGKQVRLLFSWDDFDRLRKVPANVDPSYSKYIGWPISKVPSPSGEHASYAARFEAEFERAMSQIGIEMEYRYQSKEYAAGRYVDGILKAVSQRHLIAEVLLAFMSDKAKAEKQIDPAAFREAFYPINIYSRFSGSDRTKIVNFDGNSQITYRCLESGEQETIDLRETHIAKLTWKVDWPMRWNHERVVFEPGGVDHASPGGSYDVSSIISRMVYDREPPIFVGYEFISLRGLAGKMSSSSGMAVSPGQLLEIYEAPLLMWMYSAKSPDQAFGLAFDSEVIRQYDEFDREVERWKQDKLEPDAKKSLDICFSLAQPPQGRPFPFRQAIALGQIVQWNADLVIKLLGSLGTDYDENSVRSRLGKARAWLETYNLEEVIRLRDDVNVDLANAMDESRRKHILMLRDALSTQKQSVAELERLVYALPKDPTLDQKGNSPLQRAFFKDVYQLLIGKDTGPRLSTFLWAVDREKVVRLLSI